MLSFGNSTKNDEKNDEKSLQILSCKKNVQKSLKKWIWEGLGLHFGRVWDGLGPLFGGLG